MIFAIGDSAVVGVPRAVFDVDVAAWYGVRKKMPAAPGPAHWTIRLARDMTEVFPWHRDPHDLVT